MATGDFNAAVQKLVEGGLPPVEANLFICRALDEGKPLLAWADHLLDVRATSQRGRYATTQVAP